jgi:hypothetical protein
VSAFISFIKREEAQYGIDYGLFIIDTLSQCTPGADENAAQDMSLATANMIRIRRELATTVIFVHHTGKDEDKGMRGSSAIKANTDGAIEVTRNGMSGLATVKRQKDGPTDNQVPFDLLQVPITRLQGCELGNPLVCLTSDPTGSTVKSPMQQMKAQHLLKQIATNIGVGNQMSVRQVVIGIGKQDNNFYKQQVADVLPLGAHINVRMSDGGQVRLVRIATSGFGDISCCVV